MKINTLGDGIGYIKLIDIMGDDLTPALAARVSYNEGSKGKEKDVKLTKYLWENKHTSPFEMVELAFEVKTPIFIARKWMRHRTASYNEVSRRYTKEEIEFYIPYEWRTQDTKNKQSSDGSINAISDSKGSSIFLSPLMKSFTEIGLERYNLLIENGVAKEMARMFLPINMYTKFIYKTNLRNLLHFLDLRNSPHAQFEIRVYAKAIEKILIKKLPIIMEIYNGKL